VLPPVLGICSRGLSMDPAYQMVMWLNSVYCSFQLSFDMSHMLRSSYVRNTLAFSKLIVVIF
jgi:hypothetical protein